MITYVCASVMRARARSSVCMYTRTDTSYVGGYILYCFIITDE